MKSARMNDKDGLDGSLAGRAKAAFGFSGAVLIVFILSLIDKKISSHPSLIIFYVFPIFIATWSSGYWSGMAIVGISVVSWLLNDITNTRSLYLHDAWFYFNMAAKTVFMMVLAYFVHKFQEMLIRLKEQDRLKDRFLGVVAHDMRGPLQTMKLAIYNLLNGNGKESFSAAQIDRMNMLYDKVLLMEKAVNELVDVAKFGSGAVRLELARTDIIELIRRAVISNGIVAEKKNIFIRFTCGEKKMYADLDRRKITEVLDNLLLNAVKYSHSGTEVTVEAKKENGHIIIMVKDEGQGIPKSDLEKIFGFFQTSTVVPTGGEKVSGIGLAVVKGIVEAHGGSVSVESEEGKGSTFCVRLPCRYHNAGS